MKEDSSSTIETDRTDSDLPADLVDLVKLQLDEDETVEEWVAEAEERHQAADSLLAAERRFQEDEADHWSSVEADVTIDLPDDIAERVRRCAEFHRAQGRSVDILDIVQDYLNLDYRFTVDGEPLDISEE